jgi:hypothetical protein
MNPQRNTSPRLYWRNAAGDARLLNNATITLQKPLVAAGEAYYDNENAKTYRVYRVLGRFTSLLARARGGSAVEYKTTLHATDDPGAHRVPRAYCTDRQQLTAPLFRRCHAFYFTDGDNTSPVLNVTRFAKVTPKLGSDKLGLIVEAAAAIDPVIRPRLLLPWGDGSESLADYLYEAVAGDLPDNVDPTPIAAQAWSYLRYLGLAPEQPPQGWKADFSPSAAEIDEGHETTFEVFAHSTEPFTFAMAVDMYDANDPTLSSASEIHVYSRDSQGHEDLQPLGEDHVPPGFLRS